MTHSTRSCTADRLLRTYRASHEAMLASHRALLYLHGAARALTAGVWLGLLDREHLLAIGDAFYAGHERYEDDGYNRSGLWDWERAVLNRHFGESRRILLVGAGAGREVLALAREGYRVFGYECNLALVARAQRLLTSEGADGRVLHAPPDTCPEAGGTFDGLIVGWGAYMLVAGRDRRVALLREMRAQASPGTPLLVSFFVRDPLDRTFAAVLAIGGALRRLRGAPPPELGDHLEPEFVHYFTRDELQEELIQGGFRPVSFSAHPYGHAVALAD